MGHWNGTVLSEATIAQGFHRVRYSYHRDFFELLGYPKIAAHFADIWELCEPHMADDPHEALVNGREPSYWVPFLEHPRVRSQFLSYISDVLEGEAKGDERRGRRTLAAKLREVVREIRFAAAC